jgi:hypothetical protein
VRAAALATDVEPSVAGAILRRPEKDRAKRLAPAAEVAATLPDQPAAGVCEHVRKKSSRARACDHV